MERDYARENREKVDRIIDAMRSRVEEADLERIEKAYELANEAHEGQTRKSGEPYIIHPVEVAEIVAVELKLDANTVIAAFLHDVVEDTDYTIEEIKEMFGDDVAFLVDVVTKKKKDKYIMSKQLDNFKQMLDSMQYDIRAILIKLADRMHNMRTLDSMRADKQMKIAGETDYFYAPLANRLGLYAVKTELENLSMRYRCPLEYSQMDKALEEDKAAYAERLEEFTSMVKKIMTDNGVDVRIEVQYRMPYSIWRKMQSTGTDLLHTEHRHFVRIVFPDNTGVSDKTMALRIYSLLTDVFKEKPESINNYIDSPKENGYQSFHVKLLTQFGEWEEIHISSEQMITNSRFWCVAGSTGGNQSKWLEKFKDILRDITYHRNSGFIENVVTSFYNDDIMVYTPKGKPINLPKGASALDFAFEVHTEIGRNAKYARINGKLCSVKTRLHRGDCVEIGVEKGHQPKPDWAEHVHTYKARQGLKSLLKKKKAKIIRCENCHPLPGDEVIAFEAKDGTMTVHKRNCPTAISQSAQNGDTIVSTVLKEDKDTMYPVKLDIKAVDRSHLLIDLIDMITDRLQLPMTSINTFAEDEIAECEICLLVHSIGELQTIIDHINAIEGVDEVRRATLE